MTMKWWHHFYRPLSTEEPRRSSRDEKLSVKFGPCCFCARDIEEVGTDPCTVIVETATGEGQVWKCHASCFREKLCDPPESPGLFEPFYF